MKTIPKHYFTIAGILLIAALTSYAFAGGKPKPGSSTTASPPSGTATPGMKKVTLKTYLYGKDTVQQLWITNNTRATIAKDTKIYYSWRGGVMKGELKLASPLSSGASILATGGLLYPYDPHEAHFY